MLKDFYQSPNGYFRLGTIPGGYPPGTTLRDIDKRFGDPGESHDFGDKAHQEQRKETMSKLKFKYLKRDDIPAEHLPFYVEVQDGWQLDAEGAADAASLENLQARLTQAETEMNQKKEQYEAATATHLNERKGFEERIAQLEKNRGTGAQPPLNNPPAGHGQKNPFSPEDFNLTKQSELLRHNPDEAARLQAQANR